MATQEFRIQVVVDSSGARSGTKQTNRELDKVEKKASRVGAALRKAFLFLAGGAVLSRGIAAIAGFEQGLVGVGKTANIAGADLQALGKEILRLGSDLPVATSELLAIGQAAGQLGITGTANILTFTDTVAKLGTASDLAGDRAATVLARLLTVTGESVSTVGTLGSVIVRLGNEFAATESEIAGVATRVAQSTAAFDVSSAQAVALGAALKSVGVAAEAGGTAIGRSFRAIDAAVRAGGEELEKFATIAGVSAGQFSDAFAESNVGGFQLFIEGLGRIGKEKGSVADALEAIGLSGERSAAVFGTLATRSDVLALALGTAADELRNTTALEDEAAKGADTLAGDWQRLKNVVTALTVQFGESGLSGALRFVVVTTSDIIRSLSGMDDKLVGSTALTRGLTKAVIGISTALAVNFAAKAIPAAIAGLKSLKVALLTNPLTLLPGIIAIAIGSLIAFREEIANLSVGGKRLGDVVSASFDAIVERAVFIFPLVRDVALKAFEAISGFFAEVFDGMAVKFNSFFNEFDDAANESFGTESPVFKALKNLLNFTFGIVSSIVDVFDWMSGTIKKQLQAIADFDTSSPIASAKRLMEAIVGNAADGFDKVIADTKSNFTKNWVRELEIIAGLVAPVLLDGFQGLEGGAAVAAFLDISGDINEKIAAKEAERVAKAYSDSFNATVKLLPAVFGFGAGEPTGDDQFKLPDLPAAAPTAPDLNFDEETQSLDGLLEALNEEIRLLGLSSEQRAVAIELQGISLDGDLFATVAKIGLVDARLKEIQALDDQITMLDRIKGPQEEEARAVAALTALRSSEAISVDELTAALQNLVGVSELTFGNDAEIAAISSLVEAFDAGTISAKELAAAIREIKEASDQPADPGDIGAGFEAGFDRAKANLEDLSGVAEQTVVNAFGAAEDALVDFAKTGKLNISGLVDGIISDLLRLAARQALLALIGGGAGEDGGGFFAGLFGGGKAEGGTVTPGTTYVVGEEGPELFTPKGSGNIIPAGETAAILGGGGQASPVVNVAPAQVAVQNVIVSDPNEIPAAMDTPEGVRVITNILSKNKAAMNGVLGR